jgi:hypothetical protein
VRFPSPWGKPETRKQGKSPWEKSWALSLSEQKNRASPVSLSIEKKEAVNFDNNEFFKCYK